jgi:hypothetical protein
VIVVDLLAGPVQVAGMVEALEPAADSDLVPVDELEDMGGADIAVSSDEVEDFRVSLGNEEPAYAIRVPSEALQAALWFWHLLILTRVRAAVNSSTPYAAIHRVIFASTLARFTEYCSRLTVLSTSGLPERRCKGFDIFEENTAWL